MTTSASGHIATITPENKVKIENFKKTAIQLEEASKLHMTAAKCYESGDNVKAEENATKAMGLINLATASSNGKKATEHKN